MATPERLRRPIHIEAIALIFVLAAGTARGQDEDCMDCHAKGTSGAPVVRIDPSSPHASAECSECHPGTHPPCKKGAKTASCKICHEDQAAALTGCTHGEKLNKRAPEGAANAACLACHTEGTHGIRKVKDPASPVSRERISKTCYACHKENQSVAVGGYLESIHHTVTATGEKAVCADCHGSHTIDHSQNPKSRVHPLAVPDTCGRCHSKERDQYEASIHWKAVKEGFSEPPICTDCHGEHSIRTRQDPASATYAGNVTKTCAACHESERMISKFQLKADRVGSFNDSFHGLSIQLGDLRAANCTSCHESHAILPSKDPRSSTHPDNLGRTCGGCHPGAAKRFSIERVHISSSDPSHWIVRLTRTFYIWMIVLVVGGMLIHNAIDLAFKAIRGTRFHRRVELPQRFSPGERVQHALLLISFVVLAFSGFALKFPHSPFGWPFQAMAIGADIRRWSHRVAAGVFVILTLYHVIYLLLTARGRAQFRAILPRFSDLTDFVRVHIFHIRGRGTPPVLPHFSYVEKAEYWALVWGSLLMMVTGFILFFVNISLSRLPLWGIDLANTIHYMEALLACLAILVWHGYWVVFDPEVYPLNLTFLIGNPRPADRDSTHDPTGLPH